MEAIEFYNLYTAGQTTLGVSPAPTNPMLKYLYRAFPAASGNRPSDLIQFTYRAFAVPGNIGDVIPFTYRAFAVPSTPTSKMISSTYGAFAAPPQGSGSLYGAFPLIPAKSPTIPPIIQ